jgi:hypothetical protein
MCLTLYQLRRRIHCTGTVRSAVISAMINWYSIYYFRLKHVSNFVPAEKKNSLYRNCPLCNQVFYKTSINKHIRYLKTFFHVLKLLCSYKKATPILTKFMRLSPLRSCAAVTKLSNQVWRQNQISHSLVELNKVVDQDWLKMDPDQAFLFNPDQDPHSLRIRIHTDPILMRIGIQYRSGSTTDLFVVKCKKCSTKWYSFCFIFLPLDPDPESGFRIHKDIESGSNPDPDPQPWNKN